MRSIALLFLAILHTGDLSATSKNNYNFPEIYNSNPIGGRLFHQGFRSDMARVDSGLKISSSFSQAVEYNYRFVADHSITKKAKKDASFEDPSILNATIRSYSLALQQNFVIKNQNFSIGLQLRAFEDRSNSLLRKGLDKFHSKINPLPHLISPIENKQSTIGSAGINPLVMHEGLDHFQLSADFKWQILEDPHLSDLALSVSTTFPVIKKSDLNHLGISSTLAFSRQLNRFIGIQAAATASYQWLKHSVFTAQNIQSNAFNYDVYAGLFLDLFKKGGLYLTSGARHSSLRMQYTTNPMSSSPSNVWHISMNYQFAKGEVSLYANEEFFGSEGAGMNLEADFLIGLKVEYLL